MPKSCNLNTEAAPKSDSCSTTYELFTANHLPTRTGTGLTQSAAGDFRRAIASPYSDLEGVSIPHYKGKRQTYFVRLPYAEFFRAKYEQSGRGRRGLRLDAKTQLLR